MPYIQDWSRPVTATTRLFQTNRTQAVRLPKAVAFPESVQEVEVLVVGEARLIVPKGRRWTQLLSTEGTLRRARTSWPTGQSRRQQERAGL